MPEQEHIQDAQSPIVTDEHIEKCDQVDEDGSTESEQKDSVHVERLVSLGQIFPGYDEWIAAGKPTNFPKLIPTPEPEERETHHEQK